MNLKNTDHDQGQSSNVTVRPQPEFRISLTLAVSDVEALWTAAAAKMLCAPGMTLDDILDVIGPREDPSIAECVAAIANPAALPGCVLDDFWIDGLRGCPPRTDVFAGLEQRLAPGESPLRRPPSAPRARARLRSCTIVSSSRAAPVN